MNNDEEKDGIFFADFVAAVICLVGLFLMYMWAAS